MESKTSYSHCKSYGREFAKYALNTMKNILGEIKLEEIGLMKIQNTIDITACLGDSSGIKVWPIWNC